MIPAEKIARIYAKESGLPLGMTQKIISRILNGRRTAPLNRLRKKLKHHPILSKTKTWAWVAPGNVPDPVALGILAASLQNARLILKLSRQNERTGRALVRSLACPGQNIRIFTDHVDFKKASTDVDAWVVYGSDATLQKIKKSVPSSAGWIGHGHRISFSVIFKSALKKQFVSTVRKCAQDIWLYDQRGCLSPQIVWVEGEGERETEAFSEALWRELLRLHHRYGPIHRSPEVLRDRGQSLEELKVRSMNPSDLVFAGASGSGMPAVYRLVRGPFRAPAIGQVVGVKSFTRLSEVRSGMRPFLSHIQGIAFGGSQGDLLHLKKLFSATTGGRFSTVGRLQTPALDQNI